MVKKKGGRDLNPVDAFRKAQRSKEISRNKKERHLQREAATLRDDPESLKEQLKEILQAEDAGQLNPALRIRKKVLQQAYDQALRKKMAAKKGDETKEEPAQGPTSVADDGSEGSFPPLPPGPPPPGAFPPLPPQPPPGAHMRPPFPLVTEQPISRDGGARAQLPPSMLPPPPYPPPPPQRLPPATVPGERLSAIEEEDSKIDAMQHAELPSASVSASGVEGKVEPGPSTARSGGSQGAVISGQSTVVQLPKAHKDRTVTALVPSTVVSRMSGQPSAPSRTTNAFKKEPKVAPGFGLVPRSVANQKKASQMLGSVDKTPGEEEESGDPYDAFMKSMRSLGAL